jgi:ribonuclease VapC
LVVDTSVLVAIALGEPQADDLMRLIADAHSISISAVTLFETSIVLLGRTAVSRPLVIEDVLREFRVQVISVDEAMAEEALEAYRTFGKGRHPAALNFGDCFSYALAMHLGEPLLFKGDDFSKTDVLLP